MQIGRPLTTYLGPDDLLRIVEAVTGSRPLVRDPGLLASAAARPRATVLGQDAYPSLHEKAAALLHSIARNHALIDGNKRLAWAACTMLLGLNGQRLHADHDAAFELVIAVATGELDDVGAIAERLQALRRGSGE